MTVEHNNLNGLIEEFYKDVYADYVKELEHRLSVVEVFTGIASDPNKKDNSEARNFVLGFLLGVTLEELAQSDVPEEYLMTRSKAIQTALGMMQIAGYKFTEVKDLPQDVLRRAAKTESHTGKPNPFTRFVKEA